MDSRWYRLHVGSSLAVEFGSKEGRVFEPWIEECDSSWFIHTRLSWNFAIIYLLDFLSLMWESGWFCKDGKFLLLLTAFYRFKKGREGNCNQSRDHKWWYFHCNGREKKICNPNVFLSKYIYICVLPEISEMRWKSYRNEWKSILKNVIPHL